MTALLQVSTQGLQVLFSSFQARALGTSSTSHSVLYQEAQQLTAGARSLRYRVFAPSGWAPSARHQIAEQFASPGLVVLLVYIDQQFNSLVAHRLF